MILGIDPGLRGGLGWISRDECGAIAMPTLDGRVDLNVLSGLVSDKKPKAVVIEIVGTRPGESGTSALTIGLNYGLILGLLIAHGIPYYEVRSQAWKPKMGLAKRGKDEPERAWKERSVALAQAHYPSVDFLASARCRVAHDGMCEAILIAEYGQRFLLAGER